MGSSVTAQDLGGSYVELARIDPLMGELIDRYGEISLETRRRGRPASGAFGGLIRIVVGQQVSTAAARTIHGRFLEIVGSEDPSPPEVLAIGEEIRAAGLSGRKVTYILDLALAVEQGELDLESLDQMGDAEVIEAISAQRGFGVWSAEMFLISQLQRPDVLSGGDLGIRRGIQTALGLEEPPTPEEAIRDRREMVATPKPRFPLSVARGQR